MSMSENPTHFLTAVKYIKKAREEFSVPSENWTYPTRHRFGTPQIDKYYAEIWSDGMDWQLSYWIVECIKWESNVYPLLIFDDHGEVFNDWDLKALFEGIMYFRREALCYESSDLGIYSDRLWSFVGPREPIQSHPRTKGMSRYYIDHASQPRYEFWANDQFLPSRVRCLAAGESDHDN